MTQSFFSAIKRQHLQVALNDLRDPSPSRRTEAAAVIRDLAGDLAGLLPATAGMLVISALLETEEEPYEQALHTLVELSVRSPIPLSVLEPLRTIEPTTAWEVEYIADIFENASYGPPP